MFEDMSYESILQRMLDRVSNSFDKREGSIIFDALAPAAMELMSMYIDLERVLTETFADTASREYLIKRTAERGIFPYSASKASLKAKTEPKNLEVTIGSRFSLNDLNYVLTSKIENGAYVVECETAGAVGNKYFGALIPIDYIDGLQSIELVELLIPGEDEESTEVLRNRYLDSFEKKAFGGNVQDYKEKTLALPGVGAVKVTPVWNGGGTVLLTILDSELNAPSDELIAAVKNAADPTENSGNGYGFAPIGHTVTVKGADEIPINISAVVEYGSGYNFSALEEEIKKQLSDYLLELHNEWQETVSELTVRISRIETRLLSIKGIVDISNTNINGVDGNYSLGIYEIPILGSVEM